MAIRPWQGRMCETPSCTKHGSFVSIYKALVEFHTALARHEVYKLKILSFATKLIFNCFRRHFKIIGGD